MADPDRNSSLGCGVTTVGLPAREPGMVCAGPTDPVRHATITPQCCALVSSSWECSSEWHHLGVDASDHRGLRNP